MVLQHEIHLSDVSGLKAVYKAILFFAANFITASFIIGVPGWGAQGRKF